MRAWRRSGRGQPTPAFVPVFGTWDAATLLLTLRFSVRVQSASLLVNQLRVEGDVSGFRRRNNGAGVVDLAVVTWQCSSTANASVAPLRVNYFAGGGDVVSVEGQILAPFTGFALELV